MNATAQERTHYWTITPPLLGLVENDSFLHTDRHYTNGLYASATSGELTPNECEWCANLDSVVLLPGSSQDAAYHWGFFGGQSMFTPSNLNSSNPNPRDRPYAGWLYVGFRLYREAGDTLDRAELAAGVVGPGSGADATQRFWHALHWFGGVEPHGWHAQIKDEPGFMLTEQRIWRSPLHVTSIVDTELLPEVNVHLGNVMSYVGAGITFRVGSRLLADWGPPRIDPAITGSDFINYERIGGFAWYLFAGVEGRAVARNIFLDGNTLQHSASVSKEPLVADFNAGFALLWDWGRLTATYTDRTHEFKLQDDDDQFLSFSFSFAL